MIRSLSRSPDSFSSSSFLFFFFFFPIQVQRWEGLHTVPSDWGPAGPHLPSFGHGQIHTRVRVLQALPRVVSGAGGPLRGDGRAQHCAHLWRTHPRAPLHHQVPGVLTQPVGSRIQEHAWLLHHRWVEEGLRREIWLQPLCVWAFTGMCCVLYCDV